MQTKAVFERTEKKYVISIAQKNELLAKIADKIRDDEFGESTIRSLYFDTDDFRLIRTSIDKPIYKEKLRLRSYSAPKPDSTVFLELKKKYKGVVYKRREKLKYEQVNNYLSTKQLPKDTQIMREIDWVLKHYPSLAPRMFILYDRNAYYGIEDSELRITFDKNLRYRTTDLDLSSEPYGDSIIGKDKCIMEIKALGAMPLWLCTALSELQIYPSSFSKYGTAYKIISQNSNTNGGINCA
jgi:SPX domain protein involved in polyphosphate accumulation